MLLALLFVAVQQFGMLHQLDHAVEQLAGLPQTQLCEACLEIAALDSPALDTGGTAAALPHPETTAAHWHRSAAITGGAPGAYRSRAPPTLHLT